MRRQNMGRSTQDDCGYSSISRSKNNQLHHKSRLHATYPSLVNPEESLVLQFTSHIPLNTYTKRIRCNDNHMHALLTCRRVIHAHVKTGPSKHKQKQKNKILMVSLVLVLQGNFSNFMEPINRTITRNEDRNIMSDVQQVIIPSLLRTTTCMKHSLSCSTSTVVLSQASLQIKKFRFDQNVNSLITQSNRQKELRSI